MNMQMNTLNEKSCFYKALGDPIRLRIIEFLLNEKKCTCICHLSKHLNRDQSVIFRHVQVLKSVGILNTIKESKYLMCCIKDKDKLRKMLEN
ncbi:hypothetical protein COY27_00400 [Candidatus Woesearchaeota archaeon CG_4_10_14_0_2_um_filter_33_13]|nr:MAG: hypothetical protein COY27_00400 [Candidatus Woesearchaeota archaeon CG_4_10_14_0_2_um_filter_33_13]